MSRLQNAQKKLAESMAALESAIEIAQNSTALAVSGKDNGAGTVDDGKSDAPVHTAPPFDTVQLSQDLTAIEADLETAMKMIANLTPSGLSSGQGKDSL